MIKYFIAKIKANLERLESVEKSILDEVSKGNFGSLNELSRKAVKYKDSLQEMVRDLPNYCSVAEVIEISNTKISYANENLLLSKNMSDVRYAYEYNDNIISFNEREKLVLRFGHQLKSARV